MRVRLTEMALMAALGGMACTPPPPPAVPTLPVEREPTIRICLAEAVEKVVVSCSAPVILSCEDVNYTLPWDQGPVEVQVLAGMLQLTQQGRALCRSRFRISLTSAGAAPSYRMGTQGYAGSLFFLRVGDRLTVVNEVLLEDYLRGVVPGEIGRHEPSMQAAVEAQAIAARTYAYKRIGRYPEAGFDVYADVTDQVFSGRSGTDSLTDRAVRSTRGIILWSQKEPLEAYYCSTCGGHTSRIEAVWDKPPAASLRGRRDADPGGISYCSGAPHFRWSEAWSGAALEGILRETLPQELGWPRGTPIGALLDLRVQRRDETGRVGELRITTTRGDFLVRGDRIRWILRPRNRPILRSTLFDLQLERSAGAIVRVVLRGGGNGHGVGMCQTGALEMARRGKEAAMILSHYYPGAELLKLY